MVGGVVSEEEIAVAVEDLRFKGVEHVQFSEGLVFEEAGAVAIVDAMACLVALVP